MSKIHEKYRFKNPVFVKLQTCKMLLNWKFNSLHLFYKDLPHWWQKCHIKNILLGIPIETTIARYLVLEPYIPNILTLHMLKKKSYASGTLEHFAIHEKVMISSNALEDRLHKEISTYSFIVIKLNVKLKNKWKS